MRALFLSAGLAPLLVACATTDAQRTSWGKAGVAMVDYRVDSGQCALIAAQANPLVDVQGTAGGLSGSNPDAGAIVNDAGRGGAGQGAAAGAGASPGASAGAATPIGGSLYRDSAPNDFTQRAANQQLAQEVALRRARERALRACLTERGYREFRLTEEQRAHLRTLPEGSDERRAYLHQLGSDSAVLAAQGL